MLGKINKNVLLDTIKIHFICCTSNPSYMKKHYLLLLLFSAFFWAFPLALSSQGTQPISGRIIDKESRYPLVGVSVKVMRDQTYTDGVTSDLNGFFTTSPLPVGRYTVMFSYMGYESMTMNNIMVVSGKETILEVEISESSVVLEGATVSAKGKTNRLPINEAGLVSNRLFNAEETERYVGSRQDPARMALNFAGAQATDDSRNDIVVRGNSPLGLLWRYEDVELLNPNHFAVAGSTGGPISMLNNKVIGQSDFMTAAFPPGFGNALSGVFDIKMRSGNTRKHEQTFQFGLLGTELAVEGPISKEQRSSYLLAYRYSTLQIFEKINFNIGTSAVPRYQDLTFKLHFPTQKWGTFSLFGLGGNSNIDIELSTLTEPSNELYGDKDRDQYFSTSLGMAGVSHQYQINKNTFSKITLSATKSTNTADHFKFERNPDFSLNTRYQMLHFEMIESKSSLAWSLRHKFNAKLSMVSGVYADAFFMDYIDSTIILSSQRWITRMDFNGHQNAVLIQPYTSFLYKANQRLRLSGGVHGQYFGINQQFVLEPRLGASYALTPSTQLTAGYGLHSRLQPLYVYFTTNPELHISDGLYNLNMGFTRSHHLVGGVTHTLNPHFRIKSEVYYQYLFDVPVEANALSSFSLLNMGSGFARFFPGLLENKGTGENYGVELTIERNFFNHYYILATGSLFNSTYSGSDGIKRNTDFNGVFASRAMFGREIPFDQAGKRVLSFGAGVTWAGGRRYSPVDVDSSIKSADVIFVDSERNTLQFRNFFRTDVRLGYSYNARKVTHEFVLDVINATNRVNILTYTFDPDVTINNPNADPLREQPQLGLLPVFFYKIHF
jgi:hypothetical protein